MKVLSILGSPRKHGNTSTLLNKYLKGLKSNEKILDIKEVHLEGLTIKGCKGCNACQNNKVDFCISDDDMTAIYRDILRSDIIILASPIYFFSVTAQLKTAIDRFYAIGHRLQGKKIVFLSTYGASKLEESGVSNAVNMLEMTAAFAGLELMQQLHVCVQDKLTDQTLSQAYELAFNLM